MGACRAEMLRWMYGLSSRPSVGELTHTSITHDCPGRNTLTTELLREDILVHICTEGTPS